MYGDVDRVGFKVSACEADYAGSIPVHHPVRDGRYPMIARETPTHQCVCVKCNSVFETKAPEQKYCGIGCKSSAERRVKMEPTKADLETLLRTKTTWKRIGEIYGVSDTAIRKWAKKFDII